jgi:extracellular elastinolytic metalloproteinase
MREAAVRARRRGALSLFVAFLLAVTALSVPVAGQPQPRPPFRFQGEEAGPGDLDARGAPVAPTEEQRALAGDATVRWNTFGTPGTMLRYDGYLATGLGSDAVAAARKWIADNRALFRLSSADVQSLELLYDAPLGAGHAVMFRQRFGSFPAARDGLIAMGVVDGSITFVSSSIAGDARAPAAPTLSPLEAFRIAAASVGRSVDVDDVSRVTRVGGQTRLTVKGFTHTQRVELGAVPTPSRGVRGAYETIVVDNEAAAPLAFLIFVDARTGDVLVREDLVDYQEDPSQWAVFPVSPALDYSSSDTRELWCWQASDAACLRILENSAARVPWDVDPVTNTPSLTSTGNAADSVENWFSSDPFTVGVNRATPRPDRDYVYPWTNQWFEQACDPANPSSADRNDIDAAIANLFAMHNRMHDWSYFLGFTEATFNLQQHNFGINSAGEGDREQGNAQAGGFSPPPQIPARDNANQITFPDGIDAITNMYLWQPLAAAFYSPCVDGDFDMTVIAHEYTHAISNRMVAGPTTGLSGLSSRAMGESWSDLTAVEYLMEYGFVPMAGENPFAVGPYVTGDHQAGIRNYGMNQSPLNYSDVGYDFACNTPCPPLTQVHADGEIWSAVNYDIRQAMIERYGSGDAALQEQCADGAVPVEQCPGNRRWIQLVFDAYLLMATGTPTMLDARDAMLGADVTRFGGANQDLLWNAFARRGFGDGASAINSSDADPIPSFTSPHSGEATVTFRPVDLNGNLVPNADILVGRYEARVVPIADTNGATSRTDTAAFVPGTYEFAARARGFGLKRFTAVLKAGQVRTIQVPMSPNLASSHWGATAAGDGINLGSLIDDTEATNWASLNAPVAGRQVTVRLDPSKPWHEISRIQVSAMLRQTDPSDPGGDTGGQSRFSALRSFEIWVCEQKQAVTCANDADFKLIFTSPADAFPAIVPRPRAPELILQSFAVPKTKATFVRLRVVTNQCTGGPAYQGEQDNDPANITDCEDGSTQDLNVRAAELQVFLK